MNFDLNVEQKLLKDSARNFLSKEMDSRFLREMIADEIGYDPKQWRKMSGLGWIGLLIPEEYDGMGMGYLDMITLLMEMGYACYHGPFFPTAVTGVLVLMAAGNEEQKSRILPGVARGRHLLTLAWTESEGIWTPAGIHAEAKRNDNTYTISGTKLFVPHAHVADTLICAVRTSTSDRHENYGISLFAVERNTPGILIEPLNTMTGEKLFEVRFNDVIVKKENLLGEPNRGWPILADLLLKGAVAKCAEMTGGGKKVLEMAVDYAKNRIQFQRPIGSFQAIQHHLADLLTCSDTLTLMTLQTAWRISKGLTFAKEASMCKSWANDAYHKIVMLGHQVVGGIGFIEEYDIQLYFKQAKAAELAFGDGDFHRELVAQQMEL